MKVWPFFCLFFIPDYGEKPLLINRSATVNLSLKALTAKFSVNLIPYLKNRKTLAPIWSKPYFSAIPMLHHNLYECDIGISWFIQNQINLKSPLNKPFH